MGIAIALAIALAALACVCVAQWRALRTLQTRLADQRKLRRWEWLEWWTLNALETPPHDPARLHFIRYALAAIVAPDFETLQRDLQRQAADSARDENERAHARAFADEMDWKVLPWDAHARAAPGRPPHNREALLASYRGALEGWPELLTRGQCNSISPDMARLMGLKKPNDSVCDQVKNTPQHAEKVGA
jgi:hypothetical protein